MCYITQVSHAQPRHDKLKQQKDFYKIFDPKNPARLMAVINSMDIGTKAKELYDLKCNRPEHVISKRCIDFKHMEHLAFLYKNDSIG